MRLYWDVKAIIDSHMDIMSYFKFIFEYGKFKNLFLNQEQQLCFEFLKKPIIDENDVSLNYGTSVARKIKKLIHYFSTVSDHQFFDILSSDVQGIIKTFVKI
jgi:hypothetical protein